MSRRQAELLLAAVILTRSTGYLFSKAGIESLGVFNLLAARFLLAFALLAIIFFGKFKGVKPCDILRGAVLGGVFALVMALELIALKTTDTSTASFLENTAIIFVPLIEAWLLRRAPERTALISAAAAVAGVALLTLGSGGFGFTSGELYCLCAALLYALAIIITDRFSRRGDGLMIGVMQVGFVGIYALAASFIFEAPRLPSGGTEWGVILVLAIVCTCVGFTFQPVAQAHLSSECSGLFCALSPVFASLLGVVFLGEAVTLQGVFGSALILFSLYIPHIFARKAAVT
ncbi:MAG: DMT family transporter [Oscillospiraceae bacterium]|nr:DMT family transporter [Oscillospiraceae bacterium]